MSYDQKPYRRASSEAYGARCIASPSNKTPEIPARRSLPRIRRSQARSASPFPKSWKWRPRIPAVKYSLGSVLNHVLLHRDHQRQEAIKRFDGGRRSRRGDQLHRSGSNFAGFAFYLLGLQLRSSRKRRFMAVDRRLSVADRGKYAYDFGDTAHLTPLVKMHALARRYSRPASTPAACVITAWRRWSRHIHDLGLIEARAYHRPASTPASSSRAARASCRRGATPRGALRRGRGVALARKAGWSCSTCPATAISTCRPISATSRASWSIENYFGASCAMARSPAASPPSPCSPDCATRNTGNGRGGFRAPVPVSRRSTGCAHRQRHDPQIPQIPGCWRTGQWTYPEPLRQGAGVLSASETASFRPGASHVGHAGRNDDGRRLLLAALADSDPDIAEAIRANSDQRDEIELIASEISSAVPCSRRGLGAHQAGICRRLAGQPLLQRLPIRGHCRRLAIERVARLFGCAFRHAAAAFPRFGECPEVFMALMQQGGRFMGLNLAASGRLTHGSPVDLSGRWFKVVPVGAAQRPPDRYRGSREAGETASAN